jgi:hypothetical protein
MPNQPHPNDLRPVRFVLLGEGRTGSNLLVQALNSHPAVRCFGEVFNWTHARIDYGVEGYERESLDDLALRTRDPIGLLQRRIWGADGEGVSAVGFKLHYGHPLGFAGLEQALTEDRGLRIVHVRRANLLRLYLSLKQAEATGVWKDDPSQSRPAIDVRESLAAARHPRSTWMRLGNAIHRLRGRRARGALMTLTVEECREFFLRHQLQAQRYDELFHDHPGMTIYYEQILSDRDAALARVQQFLDVPVEPLAVTLRRQNARPLAEVLGNYGELRAAFAGTPHAAYFDDGPAAPA